WLHRFTRHGHGHARAAVRCRRHVGVPAAGTAETSSGGVGVIHGVARGVLDVVAALVGGVRVPVAEDTTPEAPLLGLAGVGGHEEDTQGERGADGEPLTYHV